MPHVAHGCRILIYVVTGSGLIQTEIHFLKSISLLLHVTRPTVYDSTLCNKHDRSRQLRDRYEILTLLQYRNAAVGAETAIRALQLTATQLQ